VQQQQHQRSHRKIVELLKQYLCAIRWQAGRPKGAKREENYNVLPFSYSLSLSLCVCVCVLVMATWRQDDAGHGECCKSVL